jgi:prepilin peptidase dependent protein B
MHSLGPPHGRVPNMLSVSRRHQSGISLVELLIGLVVGLVVVAAAFSLYLNTARTDIATLRQMRLTQDIRSVMDIITQDVRRAGYWSTAHTAALGTANPFTSRTGSATDVYVSTGCLQYTYDATFLSLSGAVPGLDAHDYFGFRLNGGAIQMLPDSPSLSASGTAACATAGWQNLTDPSTITVTALNTSMSYLCLSTSGSASATGPCTTTGDLETRQFNITISARDTNDSGITITLTDSVLLPNNRLVP